MKALLYCCKSKPYLLDLRNDFRNIKFDIFNNEEALNTGWNVLNGTIPCECDYEIEDIYYGYEIDDFWTKTCGSQKDIKHNLLKQSCLTDDEMHQYLQPKDSYYGDCGKAIHIKNLHIFDVPKKLSDYYKAQSTGGYSPCWNCKIFGSGCYTCNIKPPQNMMYVYDRQGNKYALISIRPEWLCKILNGEKTIEVRRKVLKEMLK